jgi:sn-glycerol 3-phosphate transport system ATP-binding protein
MHAISLENVSKRYAAARGVDRISFEAEAGAFVVLLGPSGCGKSTTLRLIAGLETLDDGRILIDGTDVTRLQPSERRIAMVFQSYALFPHLNVAENILFGLRVRGVPKAEAAERLSRTAELLGLGELLGRKPSQLSGGQQQRTALGRAIIAEQPVCLMDEPLSNLDARLRQEMRREIRALQRKLGITILYVTHDQAEAMSMSDRVILLNEGRVEQDAPPDELYARPRSVFAARFIGTPPMNIVPLADGPDGAVIRGTAGPVVAEGRGEGYLAGLRPEDIALERATGGEALLACVMDIEYLGADSVLRAHAGEATIAVRLTGKQHLAAGELVRITWPREAVHLFDAAGGARLDVRPDAERGTLRRVGT